MKGRKGKEEGGLYFTRFDTFMRGRRKETEGMSIISIPLFCFLPILGGLRGKEKFLMNYSHYFKFNLNLLTIY